MREAHLAVGTVVLVCNTPEAIVGEKMPRVILFAASKSMFRKIGKPYAAIAG
ncbi:MAG: hypothetical protein ABSF70_15795 [Terracidiphilus sp.]|jgi:hypothetical protein